MDRTWFVARCAACELLGTAAQRVSAWCTHSAHGHDSVSRRKIRGADRDCDCIALADSVVSTSWFDSDLVAAHNLRTSEHVWVDHIRQRRVRRGRTDGSVGSDDHAAVAPDKQSCLAGDLLPTGTRSHQRLLFTV